MPISTTIVAVAVNLLSFVLPLLGLTIGNEALTTTVQTILVVCSGLWIYVQRVRRGDVNFAGVRK